MSTPIKIQAAIFCGGKHDFPVSLIVPLGRRKRSQYDDYAEGYAQGKGWTVRAPDALESLNRAWANIYATTDIRHVGASDNDWRCPECSKAGAR